MFGINSQVQIPPAPQETQNPFAMIGTVVSPTRTVLPAALFTVGGINAGLLAGTVVAQIAEGEIKPGVVGLLSGLTCASIITGAIMTAENNQITNQRFDQVVAMAGTATRNSVIFSKILESDLYHGARSFEMIVDALAISDSDKACLKQRYAEYQEQLLAGAVDSACVEYDTGYQIPPQQVQQPQQPQPVYQQPTQQPQVVYQQVPQAPQQQPQVGVVQPMPQQPQPTQP